ncbi:NUDIX hydrolase [Paenibacillus silvisoli]|uniref:NUDIX hydrolase n=1 Tax=Paenibacillus silvisoli TaxID=3110539 RepID=UPI002804DA2A|nr:8-oxo-dGTP diphosphatase [Paenibacillus silvisoli]
MYKYTICFIEQNGRLLMLNRNKPPAMGLWNGVGGKLEDGETPLQCAEREVFEETGLQAAGFRFRGIVSWCVDGADVGGMYVFHVKLPDQVAFATPVCMDEGILDWKERSWVLAAKNYGVGVIIPRYLNAVLSDDEPCYEHRFVLAGNRLMAYEAERLVSDELLAVP